MATQFHWWLWQVMVQEIQPTLFHCIIIRHLHAHQYRNVIWLQITRSLLPKIQRCILWTVMDLPLLRESVGDRRPPAHHSLMYYKKTCLFLMICFFPHRRPRLIVVSFSCWLEIPCNFWLLPISIWTLQHPPVFI